MNRLSQLLFPAVIALAALVITPAAALATVPIGCTFGTSAIGSEPLKATVTLNCTGYVAGDAQVDDASLIGPATVHFYSGPDLEWTKTVAVPVAGKYKLSITITFNSLAGPVTGTSTCCTVTVYDVAPTPTPPPVITPAPVTPAPATPRPATPRPVITPRPATPQPVSPTATPVSTASPEPSDSPSASPTEVPSPSASPSQSAPPEPTASPTDTSALMLGTTSPDSGSDAGLFLVLSGLIALGLATISLLLLVLWRKRRSNHQVALDPSSAAVRDQ